jgi:type II secretory pathway pseudopilin PulG
MKPAPQRQAGYTIVEVMLFLVISMVLLIGALGLFNGRIARTQFSQSVQALDTKLKTIANETATGNYPSNPDFSCAVSGGQTTVDTLGTGEQGSRTDCTFLGKVINFTTPASNCKPPSTIKGQCTKVEVYTVVGRRTVDTNGTVPSGLTGATGTKPVIVPNITQSFDLGYSMRVSGVYQNTALFGPQAISGLGFFQSLNGNYTAGTLGSGSQNVETWMVKSPTSPIAPVDSARMNQLVSGENMSKLLVANNLFICLHSGSTSQYASLTLSSAATGGLTTNVVLGDALCQNL